MTQTIPARTLKDVDQRVAHVAERLEDFDGKLDDRVKSIADHAALERVHQLSITIQDRIEKTFKTAFLFVSGFITILGALGYFGIQTMVASSVKDRLDTTLVNEIKKLKEDAEASLKEIHVAKSAAGANPLIILQTDYGAASPYMGALKGRHL